MLLYRAVLGSEQNWAQSTEFLYTSRSAPAHTACRIIRVPTREVQLLQLMNCTDTS